MPPVLNIPHPCHLGAGWLITIGLPPRRPVYEGDLPKTFMLAAPDGARQAYSMINLHTMPLRAVPHTYVYAASGLSHADFATLLLGQYPHLQGSSEVAVYWWQIVNA